MHSKFWRAVCLFVFILDAIFQEGIHPVVACSIQNGVADIKGSTAVCKTTTSCAGATIENCDNVFCIGDLSCKGLSIVNTNYVECFSTGGMANAACTGFSATAGVDGILCLRCVQDGCSGPQGYVGNCASAPSSAPSLSPSSVPSLSPSSVPSLSPSSVPSISPTVSSAPSSLPSFRPSQTPVANTVTDASPWETILPLLASGALVVGMLACLLL